MTGSNPVDVGSIPTSPALDSLERYTDDQIDLLVDIDPIALRDIVYRYKRALEKVNAIKTDDPIMGFQEYYDAVTDTVREALWL